MKKFPAHAPATYCPICGGRELRCMTKKIAPKTVRVRWLCTLAECLALFDVFHGGR